MSATQPSILKRGRRRTVELVAGASERVVKRVSTAGALGVHRARAARREFEVQARLFEAGLAVAQPLGIERGPGFVELSMRRIDGARSLAELMQAGVEFAPGEREQLAVALGRLLARAHALGLEHADLHEKNVLVGADGRPRLIDFHGARLRARASTRVALRDLIQMEAATRERVSARLRRRALIAWWKAVDERARPARSLRELASSIGPAARERRRQVLLRSQRRWLRDSSATRRLEIDGERALVRVELADGEARALDAGAWSPASTRALCVRGRAARDVRALWCAGARLEEHALDAARPLALVEGRRARAWFSLPRAAAALGKAWASASQARRLELARGLGTLFGSLADRGLRIGPRAVETTGLDAESARLCSDGIVATPDGRAWVVPLHTLLSGAQDEDGFAASVSTRLPGASAAELDAARGAWRRAAGIASTGGRRSAHG